MVLLLGVSPGRRWRRGGPGEFAWKPVPGFTIVKLFVGGLVMGAGALVADGCNITQGLTNSATSRPRSLTAFAAMLGAAAWPSGRSSAAALAGEPAVAGSAEAREVGRQVGEGFSGSVWITGFTALSSASPGLRWSCLKSRSWFRR